MNTGVINLEDSYDLDIINIVIYPLLSRKGIHFECFFKLSFKFYF